MINTWFRKSKQHNQRIVSSQINTTLIVNVIRNIYLFIYLFRFVNFVKCCIIAVVTLDTVFVKRKVRKTEKVRN